MDNICERGNSRQHRDPQEMRENLESFKPQQNVSTGGQVTDEINVL